MRRKAAELEAVFESLGDGLVIVGASGSVVEANQAALTLFGYATKAEILKPIAVAVFARILRTDGVPARGEDLGIQQALRNGQTATSECILRSELGGPRWIETVVSPIRDESHLILGAAMLARDVTERRRHERDLGMVAAVTDALMSADDVGAALGTLADRCVLDLADWCAVYQLDEGTDLLRLTAMRQRDGRLGAELASLLAHRPARLGEGFAGEAVRTGQSVLLTELPDETIRRHAGTGVEAQVVRRLGLRSLVTAPLRGPSGSVGAICVGWTSTRRRPDEQDARLVDELARRASMAIEQARCLHALDHALGRLELVLDSMAAGLLILGGDGRAILVNATARAMLGMGVTGINSTMPEILTPYEDRFADPADLDDVLALTSEMGIEASGELQLVAPRPMDLAWIASPVRDDRDVVLGQVMIWLDVTDIRAAERLKDDLAADLSDALRLPLQTLSTHAVQALRRGRRGNVDPTLMHGLEVILRNARQVSMHVNDLVDAARFDADALTLDLIEVNAHDIVQQAIDQARALTTTHRFRLDVPPAMPSPRWDPDRVRQALLHVLSNAIKYWPEGGQIGVRVRAQVDGVIISVRDRGLGVPPSEHERIFERYFRIAGDPVRRQIKGNGLGLYLVRGVVEAHGGTVWIESTGVSGEGTIVHVLLPWAPGVRSDV
jgi:PAS domain S-box-containing protein